MGLSEDISFVRSALQDFAAKQDPGFMRGVAGGNVPPDMFDGEVNEEGWVAWRMLPSTLTTVEVVNLESDFEIEFPPLFRAYLLANFHLFDQLASTRYRQLIFTTAMPSSEPLAPLRRLIKAWEPLLAADFMPFAQWGDGWGPMCFDAANRDSTGDCPIVWMDHDLLHPLGAGQLRDRAVLSPYVELLYPSYSDFFSDVFA